MSPFDTLVLDVGQSNMLGYHNEGPAPYTPTWRVQIWTDTDGDGRGDAFNYMNPGVNTGTLSNPFAWGPEVGMANAWLAGHPQGILWIGKAEAVKGSVGLAEDPFALDFSPRSHGEMFDRTADMADRILSNLGADHFDALNFMQGEEDAVTAWKANAYYDNLREFVGEARERFHVENVVIGRIGLAGEYSETVRQAQWRVDQEDDHVVSFKTIGIAMQDDKLHYADHDTLGRMFENGWML